MSDLLVSTPQLEAAEVGAYMKENAQIQPVKGSVSICADCTAAADNDMPELHCGPYGETGNPKCACQHRHKEREEKHEPATGPAGE
jgi:hypothetical protein